MQVESINNNQSPLDEVMDYKGAAAYLKMAAGTLRHKVMKKEIPFYKIGSSVRFSKTDINLWLAKHGKEPKQGKTAQPENSGGSASVGGGND
jgi:excisionase family DNA binding protein